MIYKMSFYSLFVVNVNEWFICMGKTLRFYIVLRLNDIEEIS